MRRLLIAASCLALIACQPAKPPAPPEDPAVSGADEAPATPTFAHTKSATDVALSIQEFPNTPAFDLKCAKAGPTITFTAAQAQVGMANMAAPFALVAAGATFPGTLAPGSDGAATFSVSAPLTPALLAAVRDATTARILVNDGYAFAESGVDPGKEFETFAAQCATMTGVVAPQ